MRYRDEENLPTTPIKTLYLDATVTPGEWEKWARECKYAMLEPEANEIWLRGCNDRGQPIICIYLDKNSQDAQLPVGERPLNWLGIRELGYKGLPFIRTMDGLRYACMRLAKKVTRATQIATWTAEWRPGTWRHDVIELSGVGNYRITDMRIRFQLETTGFVLRPCEYVGRKIN